MSVIITDGVAAIVGMAGAAVLSGTVAGTSCDIVHDPGKIGHILSVHRNQAGDRKAIDGNIGRAKVSQRTQGKCVDEDLGVGDGEDCVC